MGRVDGKIALVTGAASGIGLASAQLLAKEGAKVVLADYNIEGAEKEAQALKEQGYDVSAVFLDAGDEDSVKAAVEFTVNTYGTITVLYNNVGGSNLRKDLDVVNMDLDEWDRLINLNLKSVLLGSRFAIPYMQKAGGGSIINTASMAAFASDAVRSAYGASKAGVAQLTKYIATQYGKDHIRCNGIAPGLILTPAAKNNLPQAMRDIFTKYNALPYNGEAEDIGYAVVYLASDESKFMTGQIMQIEGGHYIANPTIADLATLTAEKK